MTADPAGVLTGAHFIDGDQACTEGCIACQSSRVEALVVASDQIHSGFVLIGDPVAFYYSQQCHSTVYQQYNQCTAGNMKHLLIRQLLTAFGEQTAANLDDDSVCRCEHAFHDSPGDRFSQ